MLFYGAYAINQCYTVLYATYCWATIVSGCEGHATGICYHIILHATPCYATYTAATILLGDAKGGTMIYYTIQHTAPRWQRWWLDR